MNRALLDSFKTNFDSQSYIFAIVDYTIFFANNVS